MTVRIELTEEQRRQVRLATGKDAVAVEVGSHEMDDEWVVLVQLTAPKPDPGRSVQEPEEEKTT